MFRAAYDIGDQRSATAAMTRVHGDTASKRWLPSANSVIRDAPARHCYREETISMPIDKDGATDNFT